MCQIVSISLEEEQGFCFIAELLLLFLLNCFSFVSAFPHFSSVQLLSCVRLSATPWTVAHQASLSITNSWSLLKLMSISSVMDNHLILCHPLLLLLSPQSFPASGSFLVSQFFASGGQSIRVSASASVLPVNIQD